MLGKRQANSIFVEREGGIGKTRIGKRKRKYLEDRKDNSKMVVEADCIRNNLERSVNR